MTFILFIIVLKIVKRELHLTIDCRCSSLLLSFEVKLLFFVLIPKEIFKKKLFFIVDPKSIDDKSSWSFIYLLFSFSPLFDPWRTCPANFSNLYMPPINWVFSFSVLFSNEPKKKGRRGHILPIAKNRTILFFPFSLFSLFHLRTKQEIIIYIDVWSRLTHRERKNSD